MPAHDKERLQVAGEVREQLATGDALTPMQARSFVRCLQTSWRVPTIKWRTEESVDQLEDARRLIHAATIFQRLEGESSTSAVQCYRRAAELLEWLSRASDSVMTTTRIELFAAGAYQLGGLPAMSSSLLAQLDPRDEGSRLYASFLKADFDGVLHATAAFWQRNPDLRHHQASISLLADDAPDKISWYITVELVRSLGLIADSLRRGDDQRLDRAIMKLDALESVAVRTFSFDASLLISLLYGAAKAYSESSIYRPIKRLAQIRPDQEKRLEEFARGQFARGRGILWSSQRHGLERLLQQSSFALCTPTGSGKTLVATLALVKELLLAQGDGPAPLGLYLVPSRALAGEVEAKLKNELGQDLIITGLYGGTDWGVTDYWLTADRPTVLIATVEKADALVRYVGPMLLSRLRLLVVDEAHQVVPEDNENAKNAFADHSSRSIRLEGLISRLLAESPDIVRIALTAVAGGASMPVARWMEGRQKAIAVGQRYRSTRQLIGMLEVSPGTSGRMLLDFINGQPLYVRGRDEPVYIPLQIPAMPQLKAVWRDSIYHFNELSVLWTALYLSHSDRRILISVAQEPEQTMGWYREALELDDWKNASRFKRPIEEGLLAKFQEARAACVDYCGENSYETALLDHGIATNHGQMPQRLRRLMTELIDRRICRITVATATLTEGVNLPFDLIFLTSLKRTSFDAATMQRLENPLTMAEFNNLAGRAGRPGATKGMEGMTLVAVPQRPSTTARTKIAQQRSQIAGLQHDYNDLRRRMQLEQTDGGDVQSPLALLLHAIAERTLDLFGIEGDRFLEWLEDITPVQISQDAGTGMSSVDARLADSVDELDGVLLSALEDVRRIEDQDIDGPRAEELLRKLWNHTFTSVAARQESWLEQAFVTRGRAMVETIYPDADERRRLYQYGFPPYIGRRFEQVAAELRMRIGAATDYGTMSSRDRLAVFESLGTLVSGDRGFGFRVRNSASDQRLMSNWQTVLAWWMMGDDAEGPDPQMLRAWQRFVSDNLEFRLGVAIGAVVAQAWAEGAADPLQVPSLAVWRETTGLPWFGFWARELLRWGTLDPFVAFALAQGLAQTRTEAARRRSEFNTWLLQEGYMTPGADDLIDPQLFLKWQRSLPVGSSGGTVHSLSRARLTGTSGRRGSYHVYPLETSTGVSWIDASGYEIAQSPPQVFDGSELSEDFELRVDDGGAVVRRASSSS